MTRRGYEVRIERSVSTHIHIRVHGVFTQQVDPEFLAGLCESKHPIEGDDICEYPSTRIVMNHIQESQSQFIPWSVDRPELCLLVIVIYPFVLMVQSFMQYSPSDPFRGKHPPYERFEFDITVIQLIRDRSGQLQFIRLKAEMSD